jgi:hypothetical protein
MQHPANPIAAGNTAKNSSDPVKFSNKARKILQPFFYPPQLRKAKQKKTPRFNR